MNDVLTEKEQIDAIKHWWRENGTQVLFAGCIVAIAYFGFNWWKSNAETKLNNVSALYEQYLQEMGLAASLPQPTGDQVATVNFLTDQLVDEYGDSHYAFLASLNTAAFDVRRGEWEVALERLGWAEQYAEAEADKLLVNYRIALLKAQLGQTEAALEMLQDSNEYFASIYAEARGDILLSANRPAEALSEFESARSTASEAEVVRVAALNAKIDSLQNGALAAAENLTDEGE